MDLSLPHIQLRMGPDSMGEGGILPLGAHCREGWFGKEMGETLLRRVGGTVVSAQKTPEGVLYCRLFQQKLIDR